MKKNKKLPYGKIKDINKYLSARYNGEPLLVDKGRGLIMNRQSMEEITGRKVNNCTLVAISRVLMYYRNRYHKYTIDRSIKDIYLKVEEIAREYGYTDKKGTIPFFVKNITQDVFEEYGVKVKCRGHYIWSFEKQVKREILAGRPVILNIARGVYRNHTVTVIGYCIYKVNGKEYPVLKVADGWNKGMHYIDYNAFARDISQSVFGSFNTIKLV